MQIFKIIVLLSLIIIFLSALLFFTFVQEEVKNIPKKNFEILDISVEGNAVTLHNRGTANISFNEIEVFVNEQIATVVNKELILHPGEIAVLVFATPVFGENLQILIKGPDNEISFVTDIIESGLPTACLDNICNEGETALQTLFHAQIGSVSFRPALMAAGRYPFHQEMQIPHALVI